MKPSSFDQFIVVAYEGDAISNEIAAMQEIANAAGIGSHIYAECPSEYPTARVEPWSTYRGRESSVLLIHYAISSTLFDGVFSASSRKSLLYHNVTPPAYFKGMPGELLERLTAARANLARYKDRVELALADSTFSANELTDAGYRNVIVLPYIMRHSLYEAPPDESVLDRCSGDGIVNLLSVGRVAPNKCLEDSILSFHYFHKWIEPRSRLFIVGSSAGTEYYHMRLNRLVNRLGLADSVIFAGRVSQAEMNAYYNVADAFLMMSEHEGFCVPLVEAMLFDVPVFANAACAVPETMRGAGVLLQEKVHAEIAEAIGIVISDPAMREQVLQGQREAVKFYSKEAAARRFSGVLASLGF